MYDAFTLATLKPEKWLPVSRLKVSMRSSGLTVTCTTCPLFSNLGTDVCLRIFMYLFFLLCVWVLRKTNAQESYQISTNISHSSEGMRPYGALVYNALHLDRYCVTECTLRTGWPGFFLGGGGGGLVILFVVTSTPCLEFYQILI